MLIAHIIMAHQEPHQTRRLIDRLIHPQAGVYIHVDKKVNEAPFAKLQNDPSVYFIKNRTVCNWGGFNFLKGAISCVQEILSSGKKYDFINLISAQDYPLVSADQLHDFFNSRKGRSYISYESIRDTDWMIKARARYQEYHFTDLRFKGKYLLQSIVNKAMPTREFPKSMDFYGGPNASWWTLSADCAAYIVQQFETNKKLFRFLKYTWGSDEFAIPTLIMNSPFKESTVNNNLRYIDWSEGKARPKLLTVEDFDQISTSGMLFARKFDRNIDANILDKIDNMINMANKLCHSY